MNVSSYKGKKRVIIDPGEFYVTGGDEIISTLLGSCVAACLWDPVSGVMGMNHFLLANRNARQSGPLILSEAGRYGIHAMELLINAMQHKGAERRRMRAKVFGGANMLSSDLLALPAYDIGQLNCRFIREFLHTEKLPLEASSLGGDFGRMIHFSAGDYSVYMKRIENLVKSRVVSEERDYLQQQLEATATQPASSVQLW